jgi:ribonuclease E
VTPTLESALAGLPAKPRVHELSKRIGISNKELLVALAARGLTITSASASVPQAVAQAVIQELLGGPPDEGRSADGQPEPVLTTEEPTAGEGIGHTEHDQPATDVPDDGGDAFNPLFLPPAETSREPDGADQVDGVEAAPARSGGSRRRRGRSGGRKPAQDAPAESAAAEASAPQDDVEVDAAQTDHAAQTDDAAQTPVFTTGDEAEARERADSTGADADRTEDTDDSDDDSTARGRRRRRGRRGRGRVADTDERDDGQPDEPDADATASEPSSEPATGSIDDEVAESTEDQESEGDSDTDAEADTGSGSAAGNRRRRRRRRRTTGDETPREDDPDNTVVHVREPRLSQANAPAGSAGTGPSNEVQGVRGSTRLEAKRQRRRDSRDSSRRRPQILTEAEFLARRESVERVMAVRQRGDLAQVALLEDGILVEHFVSQTGSDSMIGSVFLGKVQNVLPSMEAAFVDIGRGRNAVIYAGEVNWDAAGLGGKARRIETALSSGDTILAQVSKDPVGHKGARLTTQISLPGRFVVYVPGGGATGISRKLPDTERRRLKSIMDRIVPEDAGVIIRTAAEGIGEDELARDVERLKSQWEEITRRAAEKTSAPTQLYAEPGTLIKVVRDLFNSDITRLVVDGDDAYEPVRDYVTAVAPELADRLVRYEAAGSNGVDVFAAYRIDEQIIKALERKVHLPSGGSLVIDRTEAMTVVDVNTGKYTGSGGNLEETVTKNNLEAAEEMVRQLRLRDIGGIIVIDFIDMVLESNRELVLRRLTEALGRDRTRHQVAEVTSLGLVQMTRKRMGTGLVEAFSEPCPHCGGRGIVLHDLPVVASAIEDNSGDRRPAKGRRGRGRDGDRVEDVIPRVVEPVGRRPDPRGPKPPITAGVNRGDRAQRGGQRDERRAAALPAEPLIGVDVDSDELDWIEAAASAGIRAAQDADEDGFEAREPDYSDPEVNFADVNTDGHAVDDDGTAPATEGPDPDGPVEVEEIVVELDRLPDGDQAPDAAEVDDVPVEPVEPAAETTPARRRRGRRAAGRPAGAPATASEPVDIIVREPLPAGPDEPPAWTTADDSNGYSGNGNGPAGVVAAVNGNADGPPAGSEDAVEPVVAAPSPPRRRRAASRPAGPAAGATAAEPLIVSIPADQPSS